MRYGWKRDLPDYRDLKYTYDVSIKLPPSIDLTAKCPPVYDQGPLGSCTANAGGGMAHFIELKENFASPYVPSRLFVYYYERVIEHTVNYDSGASIRDCMNVLANKGAPHESLWPYVIANFTFIPPVIATSDGLKHKIDQYLHIGQDANTLKSCLAQGWPFIFGFTVYSSFESQAVTQTGTVPMPGPNESVLGGHAVMCVGYDDASQRFIIRNSWGPNWGAQGYFTMPYQYLTNSNLASDFWTAHLLH